MTLDEAQAWQKYRAIARAEMEANPPPRLTAQQRATLRWTFARKAEQVGKPK